MNKVYLISKIAFCVISNNNMQRFIKSIPGFFIASLLLFSWRVSTITEFIYITIGGAIVIAIIYGFCLIVQHIINVINKEFLRKKKE